MHATVPTQALRAALKQINIRRSMDSHVLIEARGGSLLFTTQSGPGMWIPGNRPLMRATSRIVDALVIEDEGKGFVDYQLFASLVNAGAFDGDQILRLRQEGQTLLVSGSGGLPHQTPLQWRERYAFDPEESRAVGEIYAKRESYSCVCPCCDHQHARTETRSYLVAQTTTQRLEMDVQTLVRLLQAVEWSVFEEQSSALSGIFVTLTNDVLTLKATNRRTFARCSHELPETGSWEYSVLVPAWQLKRIVQLLPKRADLSLEGTLLLHRLTSINDKEVRDAPLFGGGGKLILATGNLSFQVSLLAQEFPAYAVPNEWQSQVVCATEYLRNALSAMTPLLNEHERVALQIGEGQMRVMCSNVPSATHELPLLAQSGEALSVALPGHHLLKALHPVAAAQVTLEIEPDKHVVIRASGPDTYSCVLCAGPFTAALPAMQ